MFQWLQTILQNLHNWRFCPCLKTTAHEFILIHRYDGGRKTIENAFEWADILKIEAEMRPSFAYRSLFLDLTLKSSNPENPAPVTISLHDAMGDWDLFFAELIHQIPDIDMIQFQEAMIHFGDGPRLLWQAGKQQTHSMEEK